MLLNMIQEVVMEFKSKLITGMMLAPICKWMIQSSRRYLMTCQLPNSYVFKPWYHGHTGPKATSEQICWDYLAWLQNTNRFDFQYCAFSERVKKHDMFTGANTPCPLAEVNNVMNQTMQMGEFGR